LHDVALLWLFHIAKVYHAPPASQILNPTVNRARARIRLEATIPLAITAARLSSTRATLRSLARPGTVREKYLRSGASAWSRTSLETVLRHPACRSFIENQKGNRRPWLAKVRALLAQWTTPSRPCLKANRPVLHRVSGGMTVAPSFQGGGPGTTGLDARALGGTQPCSKPMLRRSTHSVATSAFAWPEKDCLLPRLPKKCLPRPGRRRQGVPGQIASGHAVSHLGHAAAAGIYRKRIRAG